MAARLDEASLAAHGIAVNVISTTYMVPLGISSAAAVRVGQAVGRRDARGAAAAGLDGPGAGRGLSWAAAGVALWTAPGWIVRVYIGDAAVIATGAVLLRIAALFELFDGFQTVATGALRGLGDTRTPMLAHLAGYWVIGLPVAYVLCFPLRMGRHGHLGGPERGADPDRRGLAAGMVAKVPRRRCRLSQRHQFAVAFAARTGCPR